MTRLTEEELGDLINLDRWATPAPWEAYTAPCCPNMGWIDGPLRRGRDAGPHEVTRTTHMMGFHDAELCAVTRNALPRMLNEIAELRAEVALLRRDMEARS